MIAPFFAPPSRLKCAAPVVGIDALEAHLAEDRRTVIYEGYVGDAMVFSEMEMLPVKIAEEIFDHRQFAAAKLARLCSAQIAVR